MSEAKRWPAVSPGRACGEIVRACCRAIVFQLPHSISLMASVLLASLIRRSAPLLLGVAALERLQQSGATTRCREAVRRLRGVSVVPSGHLCALEDDADGQRRPGPGGPTGSHPRRLFNAEPPRHLSQGGRSVHIRQQVEAALLHEARRRLLRLPGSVGRSR